jgi:hypothetical protein
MKRPLKLVLVIISAILMGISGAAGQTTFGTITGTVTDPSGAVVPNAKVSVINEQEGTVRQLATGSTGVYTAPNLAVGSYKVEVSAGGFATYSATRLTLSSNQVLNLDVHLSLTQSGTTVQVTGAGAAISTETSNISNLKTTRDLQELPLISRHGGDQGFYSYVLQNPGVNSMPGSSLNNVQGVRQQTGVLPTMDGIAVMAYPIGPGAGAAEPGGRAGGERSTGEHTCRIRHAGQLRGRHQIGIERTARQRILGLQRKQTQCAGFLRDLGSFSRLSRFRR